MRNLRIASSRFSRGFKSINPGSKSARLASIQSRKYSSPVASAERVSKIVDELSNLTLLEAMDLTEAPRQNLDVGEMPGDGDDDAGRRSREGGLRRRREGAME